MNAGIGAVSYTHLKPGMIHVEHDWWFPEREATDDLHGAFDSNCNVLFENLSLIHI